MLIKMPRGNLETIHPRVLILSYLKKCLDKYVYCGVKKEFSFTAWSFIFIVFIVVGNFLLFYFRVRYKDAFTCMRRHRINLNLIYDHNCKVWK